MSRVCELCHKGPTTGNLVSHSHRRSKRRWLPNLQPFSMLINGNNVRIRVCTRCLRSLKNGAGCSK